MPELFLKANSLCRNTKGFFLFVGLKFICRMNSFSFEIKYKKGEQHFETNISTKEKTKKQSSRL